MNSNKNISFLGVAVVIGSTALGSLLLSSRADDAKPGYKDTPLLPGGKWHVHDSDRPHPPIVTPGTNSTPDAPGKAPSDAAFEAAATALLADAKGYGSNDFKIPLARRTLIATLRNVTGA